MAARRLILVLVLLLAISVGAAALAPERQGSETSTEESTDSSTPQDAPGEDEGGVVERGVVADPEDPATVRVAVGDQLKLSIVTEEPREIEIAELGVVGNSDPVAPALFDLLLTEPVDAPITDTSSGEILGRVVAEEAEEHNRASKQERPSAK